MTDGTTATDIGPVEDGEMNAIKQVFDKALNAIISASQLSKVVADLETRVETLAKTTESLRNQNAWLDETLAKVRQERDDSQRHASDLANELVSVSGRLDTVITRNDELVKHNTELHTQLAQARAERDEYGLKHIQASEDLDKAHKALSTINDAVKAMLPQPQAEPNDPVELPAFLGRAHTEPEQSSEYRGGVDHTGDYVEPDPTPNCDFDKPYRWDSTLSRYVNT